MEPYVVESHSILTFLTSYHKKDLKGIARYFYNQ